MYMTLSRVHIAHHCACCRHLCTQHCNHVTDCLPVSPTTSPTLSPPARSTTPSCMSPTMLTSTCPTTSPTACPYTCFTTCHQSDTVTVCEPDHVAVCVPHRIVHHHISHHQSVHIAHHLLINSLGLSPSLLSNNISPSTSLTTSPTLSPSVSPTLSRLCAHQYRPPSIRHYRFSFFFRRMWCPFYHLRSYGQYSIINQRLFMTLARVGLRGHVEVTENHVAESGRAFQHARMSIVRRIQQSNA